MTSVGYASKPRVWLMGGLILAIGLLVSLGWWTIRTLSDGGAGLARNQVAKSPQDEQGNAIRANPVRVKATRPKRQDLKRVASQPARIEPYERTEIFAKVSGYLQKFGQVRKSNGEMAEIDLGAVVEKKQVLAELWIPEMVQEREQKKALVEQAQADVGQTDAALRAAVAMLEVTQSKAEEAQADVARHTAEVAWRNSEYERFRQLAGSSAVPEAQADEKLNALRAAQSTQEAANAALRTAKANVKVQQANISKARADLTSTQSRLKVAQANLEQTLVLLKYAEIRAPFDGVVIRRGMDTGAFIQAATSGKPESLFTVVRVDRLRILTDIPETDAPLIQIGQRATLVVDAARGQRFSGNVVRLAEALDPATRTMRVEIELTETPKVLRPGMFGSVTITLGQIPQALVVPTAVLITTAAKPAVMVVESGIARRREVALGLNDGVTMQITKGLTGEELIITDGKDLVRDGQPVEVVK